MTSYKNSQFRVYFSFKNKVKKGIIDLNELIQISNIFKVNSQLKQQDFQDIINQAKKDDLIFVDSPYYYEDIKPKTFYRFNFTINDHYRLAETLISAHYRGVKWLYTNFNTPMIVNLFRKFKMIKVKTTTTKNITNSKITEEIIIKNY
ncbi:MAG: DNA adenine methylase [Candidatus Phytoplasma pyri]